jgi:hypothetical protein
MQNAISRGLPDIHASNQCRKTASKMMIGKGTPSIHNNIPRPMMASCLLETPVRSTPRSQMREVNPFIAMLAAL